MPHLPLMPYDQADRLVATATQRVPVGSVRETTYYVRAADGMRVRQVTDWAAADPGVGEAPHAGHPLGR